MKTFFISVLLFFSLNLSGQFFVTVNPGVKRVGFLYDTDFKNTKIDYYFGFQYGVQKATEFYTKSIKYNIGISIKVKGGHKIFTGLNYNQFFDTKDNSFFMNIENVKPVSFDIGFITSDCLRFRILFLTDPVNWETTIGLTYRLRK